MASVPGGPGETLLCRSLGGNDRGHTRGILVKLEEKWKQGHLYYPLTDLSHTSRISLIPQDTRHTQENSSPTLVGPWHLGGPNIVHPDRVSSYSVPSVRELNVTTPQRCRARTPTVTNDFPDVDPIGPGRVHPQDTPRSRSGRVADSGRQDHPSRRDEVSSGHRRPLKNRNGLTENENTYPPTMHQVQDVYEESLESRTCGVTAHRVHETTHEPSDNDAWTETDRRREHPDTPTSTPCPRRPRLGVVTVHSLRGGTPFLGPQT